MARIPVLSEEQEAVVQAVKAFEAIVMSDDVNDGAQEAIGWLSASPMAYGVLFGMVRAMVHRDIPTPPREYVQLVKESAARNFGVVVQ